MKTEFVIQKDEKYYVTGQCEAHLFEFDEESTSMNERDVSTTVIMAVMELCKLQQWRYEFIVH